MEKANAIAAEQQFSINTESYWTGLAQNERAFLCSEDAWKVDRQVSWMLVSHVSPGTLSI